MRKDKYTKKLIKKNKLNFLYYKLYNYEYIV